MPASLNEVRAAFEKMKAQMPGRLIEGRPAPWQTNDPIAFYIGSGDKGEKYTLRAISKGSYGWVDEHYQSNLEHLGEDPQIAIEKALAKTDGFPVYFEPFELNPGHPGPRIVVPAEERVMSFGQYQGMSLAELAEEDPRYLHWVSENSRDDSLRQGAAQIWERIRAFYTEDEDARGEFEDVDLQRAQPLEDVIALVDRAKAVVIGFGQHSGKTIEQLAREDMGYLQWMANSTNDVEVRNAALTYLFPPVDLTTVDIESIIKDVNIQIHADPDQQLWWVEGQTYPLRHLMKAAGGFFDRDSKSYVFRAPPLPTIIRGIIDLQRPDRADIDRIDPDGANLRYESREVREILSTTPDQQQDDEVYIALLSEETRQLLLRGLEFDIPEDVIREQMIDAGKIVYAFEHDEPMFLVASEAGSGKTFVLGAAMRELRLRRPELRFTYVTLRQSLVKQIKADLADYGIEDAIDFATYSKISQGPLPTDDRTIVVADEAHTAKNLESKSGAALNIMAQNASNTLYASATPYENPAEMAYLGATGVFEPHGFEKVAVAFGAHMEEKVTPNGYGGTRVEKKVAWEDKPSTQRLAGLARDWLVRKGIYAQRKKRLPKDKVFTDLLSFDAAPHWLDMMDHVSLAYDYAAEKSDQQTGMGDIIRAHKRNVRKRILEASKLDLAINEALSAHAAGEQVALFIETKASRHIGNDVPYEDLLAEYTLWNSLPPEFREYPPPVSLNQLLLAEAFERLGVDYQLPSMVDGLVEGLGKDRTGIYVGANQFETVNVTDSSAEKDKNAWNKGDLDFLIATMAKGGTGLSLHPKKKNNPRTQINLNLPWKAYAVDQVSGRCARYGMNSVVRMKWLFARNVDEETFLARRVGDRMRTMGSVVSGAASLMGDALVDGVQSTVAIGAAQVSASARDAQAVMRETPPNVTGAVVAPLGESREYGRQADLLEMPDDGAEVVSAPDDAPKSVMGEHEMEDVRVPSPRIPAAKPIGIFEDF